MEKLSYKEKFVQMNKEAKWTWITGAVICLFWWGTGFGIYHLAPDAKICYMPAWFIIGSVGSWVLAILLVLFLTKKVFRNFDMEDDGPSVDVSQRDIPTTGNE